MQLPSDSEIAALHRKYAPADAVFDLVWTHCRIVRDVATQLLEEGERTVDAELVRVGCLLHDIGVYPLFDERGVERTDLHYITHGTRGEEILRTEGFPDVICRFASHHTGVGVTTADIQHYNLPLPLQDYLAETAAERLVMYADKFHSKTEPPCFNSFEYVRRSIAKFGNHASVQLEQLAQEFGMPDLAPLMQAYGHRLRA